MANTKDLFYSGKFKQENLVGENNFFKTNEEVKEFSKSQERFLSNLNYSNPQDFAKFGSAEEYYKNAITYINSDYPFDRSKTEKLKWVNNLSDLEYYIFTNEYPRYAGVLSLTSSQTVKVYSPSRDYTNDAKNTFENGLIYFTSASLSYDTGFAFETWFRVPTASLQTNILKINNVLSSSISGLYSSTMLALNISSSNIVVSGSGSTHQLTNYSVSNNEWHHLAINFNSSSLDLFIDGAVTQSVSNLNLNNNRDYKFSKIGILSSSYLTSWSNNTGSYVVQPAFELGGNNEIFLDETRFWNEPRTVEHIGRNWFTKIDGNDFSDPFNNNLIFYYKYNEGWDANKSICLDYSGRQNDGVINNYAARECKFSGSAINSSSLVQDLEGGDPIIETSIENAGTLNTYYEQKVASGAEYDSLNIHSLYKKFPDWVLEQEEDNDPKHLKQVIQIVSSYFDDLYGKITEVSKYKHNKNTTDTQKIYPFYDRILSSTGFDVSDLFTNLDIIETISSRNDKNIFDEDIQRVKSQIYQNIYNNLMSILRSKGTKKSLKAFLRSYGISENIVKINLYSNNGTYTISDKSELTTVKKKTLLLQNYASVYVTSSAYLTTSTGSITYENCLLFPKPLEATAPYTSSLFGLSFSDSARTYEPFEAYAYLHNDTSGSKFYFYTGSNLIGSSSYFQEMYDNTPWNFVIRLKPDADTTNIDYINSTSITNDILELSGTNYGNGFERSFCISASLDRTANRFAWHSTSPYINFYVGAKNLNRTSTGIYPTNIKSIYCNFWDSYLSDDVIISHNRDITNYGVDE